MTSISAQSNSNGEDGGFGGSGELACLIQLLALSQCAGTAHHLAGVVWIGTCTCTCTYAVCMLYLLLLHSIGRSVALAGSVLRHGSMAAAQRVFGSSTARGSLIGGSSSGITSGSVDGSAVGSRGDSVVSGLSNMLGSADGAGQPAGVTVTGSSGASAVAQKLKPLGLYFAKEARAAAAGGIAADRAVAPGRSSSLSGGYEDAVGAGYAVGARPGSIADGLTNVLASGSGNSGEVAGSEGAHSIDSGTPKPKPLGQYFEKDARAATTADALSSGTDSTGDHASSIAPSHSAADAAYIGSGGGGIASENSGIGAAGLAPSPSGVANKAKPLGLYFEKDARGAVEAPALALQQAVLRQLAARQRAHKHGRAKQKALGAYFAANAADTAAQGAGDAANAPAPASERRLQGPESVQQTARLAAFQEALLSRRQQQQQRHGRRKESRPLGAYFAGDASRAVDDMMQPAPLPPLPEAVPPAPVAQLPRGDRQSLPRGDRQSLPLGDRQSLQGPGQRSQQEHGRGVQRAGRESSHHGRQQGSPGGSQHASAVAQQALGGLSFRQQALAGEKAASQK